MAYSAPSLQVYQELTPQLNGNTRPLPACVIAPNYGLHRFSVADEQALLGPYDATSGNQYTEWPDISSTGEVDLATADIKVSEATLRYAGLTAAGAAGTSGWDGLLVDGGNRVRFDSVVLASGNGYDRDPMFGTRDVSLGDYVKIASGSQVLETKVSGIIGDIDASSVSAVVADAGNQPSISSTHATVTEHIASTEFAVTADPTAYNGLDDGAVEEVYTVKIVDTTGDVRNTKVMILSASGKDDVAELYLNDTGVANALGTRGATFTVTASPSLASSSSESSHSSSSESSSSSSMSESSSSYSESESSSSESSNIDRQLVVGDYWEVEVKQAYTPATPVSGGTYNGSRDTTYLLEIVDGGVVGSDSIKIQPYTTNGYDGGALIDVSAAGTIQLGNHGVTVTLSSGQQYCAGDVFSIDAAAEDSGARKTLVLADMLTGFVTTDPLTVTLGLTDTFSLDDSYWAASESSITVAAGAKHVASYLGTTQSFDLLYGTLYADYRELLPGSASGVGFLTLAEDVEDILGPAVPENPLSLMVKVALMGANGTAVYYTPISSDDLSGYNDAVGKLSKVQDVYRIVPYNTSREVADALQAHVNAMSSPDVALFRVLWRGLDIERDNAYYTELEDGSEILVEVNGTSLTASSGQFVTKGVRAGDIVHTNYRLDNVGETIYDSYTVEEVVSETELTLVTGPSTPISPARKAEIWRHATLAEYAQLISNEASHHDDRRVVALWADKISIEGYEDLSKAYLCSLIAGMASAMAPHQPLSLVSIPYVSMEDTIGFWTSHLDSMAEDGVYLVVQDVDGTVYTRHQLTTDPSDVFTREQSVTSNLDHICRDFKANVSDLYGRGNVSTEMIRLINSRIDVTSSMIMSRSYPQTLGPQMSKLTVIRLEIDPVLRDQIWMEADIEGPVPLNHLSLKFRLV